MLHRSLSLSDLDRLVAEPLSREDSSVLPSPEELKNKVLIRVRLFNDKNKRSSKSNSCVGCEDRTSNQHSSTIEIY